MKAADAHIPNLSEVNRAYWLYNAEKNELEGTGYFCTRCGASLIIKRSYVDEETGMVAWD